MAIALIGGEISVNSSTAGFQESLDIVGLKAPEGQAGGFVLVWEDDGNAGFEEVRAQVFSNSGAPVGTEIPVNQTTTNDQGEPAVARTSDGGFLTIWTDDSNSTTPNAVGRFFQAGGAPQDDEFQTNPGFSNGAFTPTQPDLSVTQLTNGLFAMVWLSFGANQADIWLQRLRADGSAIGAPARINTKVKADFQLDPDVAALGGGGFVVAWDDGSGDDVRASVYAANGKVVRADFLVNTTIAGTQDDVAVAGLNNGGFVVVWTDANFDIAARVFNKNGVAVTVEIPVNTLTASTQDHPDVVGLANGGFAIVWEDGNATHGDGDNILIRLFDQAGNAIGGDQVVNTTLDDDQQSPVITQLEGGRLAVAWESQDTTPPVTTVQDDVRAQILELDAGAILGTSSANTMIGFSTADDLRGLGGNDQISGLNGNDDITGGAGRDSMTGGLGSDTFIFEAVADSGNAKATRDLIVDFQHLTDDIDLSAIDANGDAGDGDTAFTFLAAKGAKFTGVDGELRWVQSNLKGKAKDLTILQGDIDGNKVADFQIALKGLKIVSADDLVL